MKDLIEIKTKSTDRITEVEQKQAVIRLALVVVSLALVFLGQQ